MTVRTVSDEQLGQLARKQNDLFRRVREGTLPVERVLGSLQDLIEGNFDAIPKGLRRLIDCDAKPFIPHGWSIHPEDQLPNVVCGAIEFDPAKVAFHLDDAQKKGTIVGNKLKEKLAGKTVYGAQVLDYLLANTNLIPDSWKTDEKGQIRYVYFWGTIYRASGGSLCVRSLYWGGGRWFWGNDWLDNWFGGQYPAVLLAS
jgi:hypothetical protein